jgi:hypothetical protein
MKMNKKLLAVFCIVALIIALPACKKALTEGADARTNPLDPTNPDYKAPISITIDGVVDADYGAPIGSGGNLPGGCATPGLDLKKVYVVDNDGYWNFYIEMTPGWTPVAGDKLAIYLEWAPGGATNGIESPAAGNHIFSAFDPEGVILWDIMGFTLDYFTYNAGIPEWNAGPAGNLAGADSSIPGVAPLSGNLEMRLSKGFFGAFPPAALRVQVISYHTDSVSISCWDAVPSQGYTECYEVCCPTAPNAITVTATRN